MKNKKLLLILSIILILIFIAVLSLIISNFTANNYYHTKQEIEVNKVNEEITNNYYAKEEDGFVYFKITQIKPSACHIINFNKTDFNKEIILDLNITKYADRCSSDNRVDTISGEIEIDDPKSIEIRVDNQRVYYNEFMANN